MVISPPGDIFFSEEIKVTLLGPESWGRKKRGEEERGEEERGVGKRVLGGSVTIKQKINK